MYRNTYALINKNNLTDNIIEIKKKYPNYKYYFGVVKNNAYGHGDDIVPSLIAGGINYLAVSSLDEAINIRNKEYNIPILVLEPINMQYIDIALKNNITLTIDNLEYLQALIKLKISKPLKIHFKIDSGMNRLGFKKRSDINSAFKIINDTKNLMLEGIYTHFATSGRGDSYYNFQVMQVYDLLKDIDLESIPIIHFDRSLTFVSHDKLPKTNGVRLGIVMYGFSGSTPLNNSLKSKLRNIKHKLIGPKISEYISTNNLNLKTAFSLYSEVISLREVLPGEKVGYNANYTIKDPGLVATIAIGYADGVTKNYKYVFIKNNKYEIISDSMDMLMVLVDKKVKIGDKVEIIGPHIPIKSVTNLLNTNSYHLFNMITNRVPRIYENNKDCKEE